MSNSFDLNLLQEIWKDANFTSKSEAKNIFQKERRQNQDNYYVANCKVCNTEIKMSCRYNGDFPLCQTHRDPNDRFMYNKNKEQSTKINNKEQITKYK